MKKKAIMEIEQDNAARAKSDLEAYIRHRIEKENGLYAGIQGKLIKPRDLDDIRQECVFMKEKEKAYEENLQKAEQRLEQAKQEVDKARLLYQAAMREVRKIVEHRKIWLKEATLADEHAQDNEFEEFRVLRSREKSA